MHYIKCLSVEESDLGPGAIRAGDDHKLLGDLHIEKSSVKLFIYACKVWHKSQGFVGVEKFKDILLNLPIGYDKVFKDVRVS